jgi:hypothetical protein
MLDMPGHLHRVKKKDIFPSLLTSLPKKQNTTDAYPAPVEKSIPCVSGK